MQLPQKLFQIETGIYVAILIGVLTAAVFIAYEYEVNRFTIIYIYPESSNPSSYPNSVHYIYGIQSFEISRLEYTAQILLGGRIVKEEKITLAPSETYERSDSIDLTGVTQYPVKIELHVISPINEYKAHFWLDEPYQGR